MKKELLEQLLNLTNQQTTALGSEDLDGFQAIMDQKQQIMDQVDRLHQEDPSLKAEKYEDLLREIIIVDERNRAEFNRQYEEVRGKLNKMRQEQRVAHVYNNPYDISMEEGMFFDKK